MTFLPVRVSFSKPGVSYISPWFLSRVLQHCTGVELGRKLMRSACKQVRKISMLSRVESGFCADGACAADS